MRRTKEYPVMFREFKKKSLEILENFFFKKESLN